MKKIIYSLMLLIYLVAPSNTEAQNFTFVDPPASLELGTFGEAFTANILFQYRTHGGGVSLYFTTTETNDIYIQFERVSYLKVSPRIGSGTESSNNQYFIFNYTGVKPGRYEIFFYGLFIGDDVNAIIQGKKIIPVVYPAIYQTPFPNLLLSVTRLPSN